MSFSRAESCLDTSVEHSPSQNAKNCLTFREIPLLVYNLTLDDLVHRGPDTAYILIRMNSLKTVRKFHFNIVFPFSTIRILPTPTSRILPTFITATIS